MHQLIRIFQLVSFLGFCSQATAQLPPLPSSPVARVIVKFKDDGNFLRQAPGLQRSQSLSSRLGLNITQGDEIAAGHQVLTATGLTSQQLADQLSQLDEVEFAEPDELRKINAFTYDPVFPKQWYLQNTQASASNFSAAWDLGTGTRQTVVAVLDTGIPDHPDLRNKLVPGYNFISDPVLAMNGMGRSANPTDPGDYIDANVRNDPTFVSACGTENLASDKNSSWHGTQVAGLIAAQANNAYGMAGAGWDLRILPVRVLGKCGGRDSDILAAMLWSAGLPVSGIPNNPNPARIINLSLGSTTPCSKSYASVLAQLSGKAVVVAAAGNDGGGSGLTRQLPWRFGRCRLAQSRGQSRLQQLRQRSRHQCAGGQLHQHSSQPALLVSHVHHHQFWTQGPSWAWHDRRIQLHRRNQFFSAARVRRSCTDDRFESRIDAH